MCIFFLCVFVGLCCKAMCGFMDLSLCWFICLCLLFPRDCSKFVLSMFCCRLSVCLALLFICFYAFDFSFSIVVLYSVSWWLYKFCYFRQFFSLSWYFCYLYTHLFILLFIFLFIFVSFLYVRLNSALLMFGV